MASFTELVRIVITADSKQAVAGMKAVGASADRDLKKATTGSRDLGASFLKTGALLTGVGIAGFALATKATIDFDRAMSAAGAASDATAKQMGRLRQAALDAGKDTAFSATEAAQGITELSKAGISTADILSGALKGSLDLAAAGEISIADAAVVAAGAMNVFGLAGSDVTRVADILAAAVNKSATDMPDLAEALQDGGLTAKQMGLNLKETAGALALFGDNTLRGSEAGNALKRMLQQLNAQTGPGAKAMQDLGISAFDAQGNFVGLESVAGQLRSRLGGLTQEARNNALTTIFGARAVNAANILYKAGAEGVREYTNAVSDQGAAARTASEKMDNLAGDLERLKGSVETALIEGGSRGSGGLRLIVQAADAAVGAFAALPPPVVSAVTALTAFSGVTLLAVGAALKMKPALDATTAGISTFGRGVGALVAKVSIGKVAMEGFGATLGQSNLRLGRTSGEAVKAAAAISAHRNAVRSATTTGITFGESLAQQRLRMAATVEAHRALGGATLRSAAASRAAVAGNDALIASQGKIAASGQFAARGLTGLSLVSGGVIAAIGGIAFAALGAASALGWLDDQSKKLKTTTDDLAKSSIKELADQMRDLRDELKLPELTTTDQQLGSWRSNMKDAGRDTAFLATVMEEFNTVLKDSPQFATLFIDAMKDASLPAGKIREAETAFRDYIGELQASGPKVQAAAISQASLEDAVTGGTKAFDEFLKPLEEAAKATKDYADSVYAASNAQFAAQDASDAFDEAMQDGTTSARDREKALLAVVQATGDQAAAELIGATEAQKTTKNIETQIATFELLKAKYPELTPVIDAYILKLRAAQAAGDSGNQTNQQAIGVLEALKQKYRPLGPEIDKIIAKIRSFKDDTGNSSSAAQTAISVLQALRGRYESLGPMIDVIIGKLRNFKDEVNNTPDKTITITTRFKTEGFPVPGTNTYRFAAGGPIKKGTFATVAEQGPELFIPAAASATIRGPQLKVTGSPQPAEALQADLSGSVGGPVRRTDSVLKSSVEQPQGRTTPVQLPPGVLYLGAKGQELFVPPTDGMVIPHQEVDNTLAKFGLDPKKVPKRATGGRLKREQYGLVGEQGVELFWPDSAGPVPSRLGAKPRRPLPPAATVPAPRIPAALVRPIDESVPRPAGAPRARQLASVGTRAPAPTFIVPNAEPLPNLFPSNARGDQRARAASRPISDRLRSFIGGTSPGSERAATPSRSALPTITRTAGNTAQMQVQGANATYSITVNAGIGNPAEIGKAAVEAITAYERRNGKGWRQS